MVHRALKLRLLMIYFVGIFLLAGCEPGGSSSPDSPPIRTKVTIAAASDLKFVFDELIIEFERKHPNIDLEPTYGSSGNFYAQLVNRAPFDLFLSADIAYPRKLIEQRLADKETEFQYAVGQIVVWVRNESSLDVENRGLRSVLDPSVRKIAIANPKHAPYGRAAESALKQLDLYEQVKDRLVLGENITQTAQFVASGATDVGVVALSLAMAPAMQDIGRYGLVPVESYTPLEQGGVVLHWARDREATLALRDYLVGDQGRAILRRYGFLLPGE